MKRTIPIALIITALYSSLLFSQDGSPDTSFGTGGLVETDLLSGENEFVTSAAVSDSGRILVVGFFDDFDNDSDFMVAYLADGSIDTSFGNNGILITDNPEDFFNFVGFQEGENIILGKISVAQSYVLSRHLPDGSLDLTFGTNGTLEPFPSDEGPNGGVFIDPNDNLLTTSTKMIGSTIVLQLRRFLPDGVLDASFGDAGVVTLQLGNQLTTTRQIQFTSEEKLVLSCRIKQDGIYTNEIVRLLNDGTIDADFGVSGRIIIPVEEELTCTIQLFNDGSFLTNCHYYDPGISANVKILKLNPDGTLATYFGDNGVIDNRSSGHIQPNQRILSVYGEIDFEGGIAVDPKRYFSNGVPDSSWQFTPIYSELGTLRLFFTEQEKVLIVGSSIWYNGPTDIVLQQFNNSPLGIQDLEGNSFAIFPNPSEGIFHLSSKRFLEETDYQVIDITGKVLQKGVFQGHESLVDLSHVQKGMYFMSILDKTYRLMVL